MQVIPVASAVAAVLYVRTRGKSAMKRRDYRGAHRWAVIESFTVSALVFVLLGHNDITAEFGLTPWVAWWMPVRMAGAVAAGAWAYFAERRTLRIDWRRWHYNKRQPRRNTDPFPQLEPGPDFDPPTTFPND